MKRYVVVTLLALLVGLGMALGVPDPSEVTVTDGSGIVVGEGEFEEGSLELSLSEGVEGFLTLTFAPEEGDAVTVEVMVAEDGALLLVDTMTSLVDEIEADGGTADVTTVPGDEFADDGEDGEGEPRDGLDVADEAAGEHGAHGRAIAREARDAGGRPDVTGGDDADEVEDEDDEEPEEAPEEEEVEDPEAGEAEGDAPIETQPLGV